MEQSSELAVPGNSALSISQDINGTEISDNAIGRTNEIAEEGRVVIVRDSTGVVDSKGVECVGKGGGFVDCILGFLEGEIGHGGGFGMGAGFGIEECDVVF
jgi:hypothetical protein